MDNHVFDSIVINPDFLESLNNDTYYYIEELVKNINTKYQDKLKCLIDGNKYRLHYETLQYNIKYEKDEKINKFKLEETKRQNRRKEKKKLRREKEIKDAAKYENKYKNYKMKVKGNNIIKDVIDVMDDLVNKIVNDFEEVNGFEDNIQI